MKKEKKLDMLSNAENAIQTDPLGMYTGIPEDKTEKPQQDADDL